MSQREQGHCRLIGSKIIDDIPSYVYSRNCYTYLMTIATILISLITMGLIVEISLLIYLIFDITGAGSSIKSLAHKISNRAFSLPGLSVLLTWVSLEYQLKFNHCFRNRSSIMVSRYFSLLNLSEKRIKYITDDLFCLEHPHYDKDLKHFMWRQTNGLFTSINSLLSFNVEYPSYFLEAIIGQSQEPYMKRYIILNKDWEEVCLKTIEQKAITLELLQSHVRWLSCLREPSTQYRYDPVPVVLNAIINHPKITPHALASFCANRDPRIRTLALASPKCPEEGRVVGILANMGTWS